VRAFGNAMKEAAVLERDGYPAGVPCWVDTVRQDPAAAVSFYGDLFGWKFDDRMPADSPGGYFVAQLEGRDVAAVGSQPDQAPDTPAWNTYIWVDSADDAVATVKAAGGRVVVDPFDALDAGRMAVLADPGGAVFSVMQARNHRGAQLVNHPGTWNFSDLNTSDPERALAFYGEVFGWEAQTFTADDGTEFPMLKLPGYGDHLERRDPDLRRRQSEQGAPPGFEDVVASLVPSSGDVPPHWSVTFAVDDTDAVAARAAELGGELLVPPFDAGPTRVAVLSDPDGAQFTVSKYAPQR
jgi:uncharacterized protein